jgi:hypothetical protein
MQQTQDQKEQHSAEHAKNEEPVSVHKELYQVDKYNQDIMNPQNQGLAHVYLLLKNSMQESILNI